MLRKSHLCLQQVVRRLHEQDNLECSENSTTHEEAFLLSQNAVPLESNEINPQEGHFFKNVFPKDLCLRIALETTVFDLILKK